MAEIVAYVEQLNELDTENVEISVGGLTPEGAATDAITRRCRRINRSDKKPRSAKRRRLSKDIFKFRKCYRMNKISPFKIQNSKRAFYFLHF
jgi:Asp-tRNA(Asn)/Glu-tRNA(Gln) amidotransferase C subunit